MESDLNGAGIRRSMSTRIMNSDLKKFVCDNN